MIKMIAYDIPSTKAGNRRRQRLAKGLEKLGLRVQKSFFMIDLPPQKEKLLTLLFERELLWDEDSLALYPICSKCTNKVYVDGTGDILIHREYIII